MFRTAQESSTMHKYCVEQDTKAWSTYRFPKLSLMIKTQKSPNNAIVRKVAHMDIILW